MRAGRNGGEEFGAERKTRLLYFSCSLFLKRDSIVNALKNLDFYNKQELVTLSDISLYLILINPRASKSLIHHVGAKRPILQINASLISFSISSSVESPYRTPAW